MLALAPAILAGLVLFRHNAILILAIALGAGVLTSLLTRVLGARKAPAPIVAALIGTALVGPAAGYQWVAAVAALAAVLEAMRGRILPAYGLQMGLVAYAAVMVASGDALAAYVHPGSSSPALEPVRLWFESARARGAPIDDAHLYVGNVAGPVFATSLLAIVIAAAWSWYARRLSLVALAGFLAGAMVPIVYWHYPVSFSLNSGPLWFMAALVLAQKPSLPANRIGQALVGLVAGAAALSLRHQLIGIEGVPVVIAAIQAVSSAARGIAGLAFFGHARKKPALPPARGNRLPAKPAPRPQLPGPPAARRPTPPPTRRPPALPAPHEPPPTTWPGGPPYR